MAKTLKQPTWAETRETFIGKATDTIAKDAVGTVTLHLVSDTYVFTADPNVATVEALNLGPSVTAGQKVIVTKIGTHYFLLYHGSIGSGGGTGWGLYQSIGVETDISISGSRTAIMSFTPGIEAAFMVSATVSMVNGAGSGGDGTMFLTCDNDYPYDWDIAMARHYFDSTATDAASLSITPTLVSTSVSTVIGIVGRCPGGTALGKDAYGAWQCFASFWQVGT